MKKLMSLTAAIVAFILVVCLAGCSSNDQENSSSNGDGNIESTAPKNSGEGNEAARESDPERNRDPEGTARENEDRNNNDINIEGNEENPVDNTEDNSSDANESFDIELDKTVTYKNLTYNIPASWGEIELDNMLLYYTDDDAVSGQISQLDSSSDQYQTAQEFNDSYMHLNDAENGGTFVNFVSNEIETREINGIQCTLFENTYDGSTIEESADPDQNRGCYVYIPASDGTYLLRVTGKNSVTIVNSILDTMQIS